MTDKTRFQSPSQTPVQIKSGDLHCTKVHDLLREHLAAMHENSPPDKIYALDLSGLQRPDILFLTAHIGHELAGCGALSHIDNQRGEIKSMRTARPFLRKGVAAAVLQHIIALAKQRGYHILSLETGTGAAFEPAIALYKSHGFEKGAVFGDYEASDFNQFFHLQL